MAVDWPASRTGRLWRDRSLKPSILPYQRAVKLSASGGGGAGHEKYRYLASALQDAGSSGGNKSFNRATS